MLKESTLSTIKSKSFKTYKIAKKTIIVVFWQYELMKKNWIPKYNIEIFIYSVEKTLKNESIFIVLSIWRHVFKLSYIIYINP